MKKLHFIGIGGTGMAPLAKLAVEAGFRVSGSDSADSAKTEAVRAAGAVVHIGHAPGQLPPDADLVIYSSAVDDENCERRRARELGIPQLRRGEFLADFSRRYERVAAVSGSHGKSSTTAMLVTILERCGFAPGALIGAARIEGESALSGDGRLFVTEVDESDGTHTCVTPFLGIVTNIDGDHEWSVGGPGALEANFHTFGRNSTRLLIADTPELKAFYASHPDLHLAEQPEEFAGFAGFMAQNASLAVRAAELLGVKYDEAVEAVRCFSGIERRMRPLCRKGTVVVLEDYAHHPTEVRASIALVRRFYPGKKIHVIFQPHRFARLERFFDEFRQALDTADRVTVTPVFAAWSETGAVDSPALAAALGNGSFSGLSWRELAERIELEPPESAVLLLGAGDISELAGLLRASRS